MDAHYPEYRKAPLNNRMIVFESMWGAKFSCNPRAIYEYVQEHHPEYECVWIFTDERTPITGNGRRVRMGSLEYYKVLAEAKYLVNNVNFEDDYIKRDGQIEIQTMHGTPLKTLGFDVTDELPTPEDRKRLERRVSRWNYLVVQGAFMKEKADPIYHYKGDILETGYPRTDGLYQKADTDDIKDRLGIPKDKKVILYAPTWRVRGNFDMALDLDRMREELSDEYVLLIRIHYFASAGYTVPADNKFIFNVNDYANAEDLYKISDMMITDYSSIMFDYALLDKPLIFFTYDLKSYASSTRGVYFDIRTEAPGPIVYTTDELISTLGNLDAEMQKVSDRVQAFKDKYLTYECPTSAKKIVRKAIKPNYFVSSYYRAIRSIKSFIRKIR
jgi:CDP-glycerol glycerophosphotransferase